MPLDPEIENAQLRNQVQVLREHLRRVESLLPYAEPQALADKMARQEKETYRSRALLQAHHVFDGKHPAGAKRVKPLLEGAGFEEIAPGLYKHTADPAMFIGIAVAFDFIFQPTRKESDALLQAHPDWNTDGRGLWWKGELDHTVGALKLREAYAQEFGERHG